MGFAKLLQNKRLMIVCGLGGVGKTTLSAALALRAAQMGKKSLVITVDPAKRLASALGLKTPCPEPKEVWKEKGALYACLLDAKQTFDLLIEKHSNPQLREAILANPLYQQLSLMLAGTQEYMAMEKLYALSQEERFDILVVDTPPARHAIDFLAAPLKLSKMLNDSLLKLLFLPSLQMGNLGAKMLGAIGHLAGSGILEDIAQLMRLSLTLLDGFTKRSQAIQTLLAGKETAFILVTAANTTTTSDPLHFRQELNRLGFFLEGLCVNRMPPLYGSDSEVRKALVWAKEQSQPLWQQAGRLLETQKIVTEHVQTRLKRLVEQVPHCAFIPETPDGIAGFSDLQKMSNHFLDKIG